MPMRNIILLLAALAAAEAPGGRPDLTGVRRWACFYGVTLPWETYASLDLVVVEPETFSSSQKAGTPLPGLHSPLWAPDIVRAIPTGVDALVAAALEVFGGGR